MTRGMAQKRDRGVERHGVGDLAGTNRILGLLTSLSPSEQHVQT
jgi:hypothetical protein